MSAIPDGGNVESSCAKAQESTYGRDVDYVVGSPHLSHERLHEWLVARMQALVDAATYRNGRCRVLEVGAGHGTFTEQLVGMGADVTVSEISKASADVLTRRFTGNPCVKVVHDADGSAIFNLTAEFEVVLLVSVLHHIPDYLEFVGRLVSLVGPGGTLAAYQDPDWYTRRRWPDMLADRGAYLAWRVTRGDLLAGARTRLRRMRGYYDESLAADMTEYHVVRNGVDDQALTARLATEFGQVNTFTYWTTQAAPLQRLGERLGVRNTFGIEATDRKGPTMTRSMEVGLARDAPK